MAKISCVRSRYIEILLAVMYVCVYSLLIPITFLNIRFFCRRGSFVPYDKSHDRLHETTDKR